MLSRKLRAMSQRNRRMEVELGRTLDAVGLLDGRQAMHRFADRALQPPLAHRLPHGNLPRQVINYLEPFRANPDMRVAAHQHHTP